MEQSYDPKKNLVLMKVNVEGRPSNSSYETKGMVGHVEEKMDLGGKDDKFYWE